ncbi:hypothetical protein ACIBHY_39740 [Nonomuraea sp. NPDC050547]|uniref:hypothetical protein n=1 Tax=Nonomuraea sp. NPDC050547 TaxID=3364368 RepID=UPI0037A9FCFF
MPLLAEVMALTVALGLYLSGPIPPGEPPPSKIEPWFSSAEARSADGPVFVQSSPVRVPAGGTAEAIATCPAGTQVFGGGESNPVSGTVVLTRSIPWRGTWETTVRNNGTSEAYVTGYAVCGSGLTAYRQVFGSAVSVTPNGGQESASVDCPAGMRILGGGQWISGPLNVSVDASLPGSDSVGDDWFIRVRNHNTEIIGIQPIAICGSGPTIQIVSGGSAVVAPGEYKPATATCPAGTTLLGGGGGGVWYDTYQGVALTDSYRSGEGSWTVYARAHPTSTGPRGITSRAICGT